MTQLPNLPGLPNAGQPAPQPQAQPAAQPQAAPSAAPAQADPLAGPMAYDPLAGLGDVKRGFTKANILNKPGKYIVRIDKCDMYSHSRNRSNFSWKNTLTVLASEGDDFYPGETAHTVFKTNHGVEMFQQRVNEFLAGVFNVKDADITAEFAHDVREKGSLNGQCCTVTVTLRPSKSGRDNNGNPIMHPNYQWGRALSIEELQAAVDAETLARILG